MPTKLNAQRSLTATVLAAGILILGGIGPTLAETASPWTDGYNSRTRLVAGSDGGKLYAGVAIEMAPGWKTYWRNPGDSGGVPPNFDWTRSDNLKSAVVLYPAPKRLTDPAGDAIGYSGLVVFPVRVVADDPGRIVKLKMQLEYGICKEICVPIEVALALELPVNMESGLPAELTRALDQVPRIAVARRAGDPRLLRTAASLEGDKPRLQFEVEYTAAGASADAFLEAPEGIYVPQPKAIGQPVASAEGKLARRTFEVDLSTGVDPGELRGKTLTLTLVGAAGQTQASWPLD